MKEAASRWWLVDMTQASLWKCSDSVTWAGFVRNAAFLNSDYAEPYMCILRLPIFTTSLLPGMWKTLEKKILLIPRSRGNIPVWLFQTDFTCSSIIPKSSALLKERVRKAFLFSAWNGRGFYNILFKPLTFIHFCIIYALWRLCCSAPGPGEGTSGAETPQGPRKKRARVDPTVESVSAVDC